MHEDVNGGGDIPFGGILEDADLAIRMSARRGRRRRRESWFCCHIEAMTCSSHERYHLPVGPGAQKALYWPPAT